MITYFVHSTSTDNEKSVFSGWSDPELSLKGAEQAQRLKEKLCYLSFDIVYCSDLKRAKSTAEVAFQNTPIVIEPRLREMNYGDLNGVYKEEFPKNETACIDASFVNGENCRDVEFRVRDFLNTLENRNLNIAIVAHKYPQLAFDVICNGVNWEEAINRDWRKTGSWQPGWEYQLPSNA